MSYSDIQLRNLAQQNPRELIRIITSPNGDAKTLTSGAEILGEEVDDESLVVPALRQLLKHAHAFVREGAMNGVSSFFNNNPLPRDILERLRAIAKSDPSPTNKEVAADLVKTYEKK
jgi:hypothetical protein